MSTMYNSYVDGSGRHNRDTFGLHWNAGAILFFEIPQSTNCCPNSQFSPYHLLLKYRS